MKVLFLILLATALFFLHQDYWNWGNKSLVFGFIPVGLAYHGAFSIVCAGMMVCFVKFAWPTHLEDLAETPTNEASSK